MNIKISDQAPSFYLKDIQKVNANIVECLENHLIAPELLDGEYDNDFDFFIQYRTDALFNIVEDRVISKQDYIKQLYFEEMKYDEISNIPIYAKYKDMFFEATFNPSTSKVFYNGNLYDSPSTAALSALNELNSSRVSENGWIFWKFKDKNGEEKKIKELRKKL
ncbi:MAG: hypothetical protein R3Y50_08550 [Rikenellaceae bacterium]